jgi:DnaJ-class molecular chaperone
LGEDAALAGSPTSTQVQSGASEVDSERAALEEKIRSFLQSQQRAGRSSALARGDDEDDVETFWKMLTSSARANWIVAYYAENSGDMEIKDPPELRNCQTCGGRGLLEQVITGSSSSGNSNSTSRQQSGSPSGRVTLMCETCKGIGRVRRIRYR